MIFRMQAEREADDLRCQLQRAIAAAFPPAVS